MMIDHLSLGTANLESAVGFYQRLFAPLDVKLQHHDPNEASFGPGTDRTFWLYANEGGKPIPGMHIAFAARSQANVDQAFAASIAAGATAVRPPGKRPEIS